MGAPAFPGRPGWPLIGNIPNVVKRGLLDTAGEAWRELGDVFRLRISGGLWLYFVAHPDGAEHVLKTMRRNYVKGSAYDSFRRITGNGLLTAEGEDWRRKRRRIQPAFGSRRVAELADVMARVTGSTIDDWEVRLPDGQDFDLGEEMTRITLRIVGQTLFGIDLADVESRSTQALAEAMHHASVAGNSMRLPLWVPTPGNLRMKRNLATLDETVFDIIARGRAREPGEGEPTLLRMLIDARDDETGEQFGDRELRDEVITMFLAGHETTALTLTWCLQFLSRHPAVVERLVEEIDRELGDAVPTMADCERLTYTRAVIEETLRLRPPAWAVARNALEDDVVMGHEIPSGALVVTAIYFIHHHPEFWDDPEAFDPTRFLDRAPRHEFDNLPFSRGPRKCIGAGFAMIESQIVLAMLLRRAVPEAVESEDVAPRVRVTLHPARPITMRFRWRKHRS